MACRRLIVFGRSRTHINFLVFFPRLSTVCRSLRNLFYVYCSVAMCQLIFIRMYGYGYGRAQTLYALRVLRAHGVGQEALQTIFQSVAIAKLLYASSA